ncbi:hypothetical protein [Gorillibacterium sp. sgz5001074]|uniref:hypothetical protein n=1 Tax=Gorillibacterium sp. sgz5001074 TaxID=3446695 RepID=UPI003F665BF7
MREENWLKKAYFFQRDVRDLLVDHYGYNKQEAEEIASKYGRIMEMAVTNDHFIEPLHVASRIHRDYKQGVDPSIYYETLSIFYEADHALANTMKIPKPQNRTSEVCWKCGLFKYVDDPCIHCGGINKR